MKNLMYFNLVCLKTFLQFSHKLFFLVCVLAVLSLADGMKVTHLIVLSRLYYCYIALNQKCRQYSTKCSSILHYSGYLSL